MSFYKSAWFDEVGLHGQRSWKTTLCALAVCSAVLAFPTGQKLVLDLFFKQAGISGFALSAVILICFGLARLLGSPAPLENFFKSVASVAALGLAVSFVLGWLFIYLGQSLHDDTVTKAAFSLVPFYSFALFGWGVEKSAHLHDYRGFVMAVFGIALFVLLHFGLEAIVSGV